MLQWMLRLGQNVTVDVVNMDVTSRRDCSPVRATLFGQYCPGNLVWQPCSSGPFLAALPWQLCSTNPVLPVPFCFSRSACSSCSVCPVLSVLFCVSYLPVLFCLSRSACPVLPVPFCLSWFGCIFCLSCSAYPVLPFLFCLNCVAGPVLPVLFCLSFLPFLFDCPVLPVPFGRSSSVFPVFEFPVLHVLFCMSQTAC
jgi:hypothetical protein